MVSELSPDYIEYKNGDVEGESSSSILFATKVSSNAYKSEASRWSLIAVLSETPSLPSPLQKTKSWCVAGRHVDMSMRTHFTYLLMSSL